MSSNSTLKFSKFIPYIVIVGTIFLFTISFIRGNLLVKKSEKEFNPKKQEEEAQAKRYILKEIDAKSGQLRWILSAKEGKTEDNLQAVFIKDINAEVYKNESVIFQLRAPYARANASTKEIYLLGEVTAKDKDGKFSLITNQLALGMGTSIEAQKGFKIILKNIGTIIGTNALINDDQTKITVIDLKEGSFKDILLSGKKVYLEKDIKGDITKAVISDNGKIILKNQKNDSLTAGTIKWNKNGNVEAINNVIYTKEDKIFKAGYLLLKGDKSIYAKNKVLIIHGKTQCYGNSLSFENNSLVTINGNPKAIQGDKQITADKIVYYLDSGKVEAQGHVRTIMKDSADKVEKS